MDILRLIEQQNSNHVGKLLRERILTELEAIAYAPETVPVYEKSGETVRVTVNPADRNRALKSLGKLHGLFFKDKTPVQAGPRLEYRKNMSGEEARRNLLSYLQWQRR